MKRGERHPLLGAACVAIFVVAIVPATYLIVRCLQLGGDVAIGVLSAPATWWSLGRSLGLALVMAVSTVAVALPLAWITHATDVPGRRLLSIGLVMPLAVPSYVGGFVVLLMFAPGGAFPSEWVYGLGGVVLALSFTFPFAFLILRAALARLDPRLWESARALGASPRQAFVRCIFPQLRPAMASGGLMVALYAIGDFGAVSLLRFDSLSYLIYVRYKSLFDRDEAIVLSLLLAALASLLVFVFWRMGGRTARDVRTISRRWPLVHLGSWRWPAFAVCAALIACFVVLPVVVVAAWGVRGVVMGQAIEFPTAALWTSATVAAISAAVIIGVAFLPAVASKTVELAGARWLSAVSYLGYALPGIVVALALVSVTAQHVSVVYQTIPLLVTAYLVRFFPLAVDSIGDAVGSQSSSLFRAARSLGATPARAWWRVTIPLARPAAVTGFLAVFIAVAKELPATLILSPPDFRALSTNIWGLTEDAYFAAAAPSVLVLLAMAAVALTLGFRRQGGLT